MRGNKQKQLVSKLLRIPGPLHHLQEDIQNGKNKPNITAISLATEKPLAYIFTQMICVSLRLLLDFVEQRVLTSLQFWAWETCILSHSIVNMQGEIV